MGGLDISLPLLYTKNLVKAFIQLAHSYMEVQPALLSWIAYRVGGLCLAPESGVQGCAGSVWNHHLMRADLGHHLPNQPSVTSCRWPAVGHNGSIYVMGNRKTLEIGTALSPPPQRPVSSTSLPRTGHRRVAWSSLTGGRAASQGSSVP